MKPYLDDPDFLLYQGDALETLRGLPAASVHMCVTSPPYYSLRDYGTGTWVGGDAACDHKAPLKGGGIAGSTLGPKRDGLAEDNAVWTESRRHHQYAGQCAKCGAVREDLQVGLEKTPAEYILRLVEIFREVGRVLRDDGTLWIVIGDSYFGDSPPRKRSADAFSESWNPDDTASRGGLRRSAAAEGALRPKNLIGIPWRLAFALQDDGWWLRNEIIWQKPDPLPESVTDRATRSHETIFMLSKRPKYFFDHYAVKEPHHPDGRQKTTRGYQTPNSHSNYDNFEKDRDRWPNGGRNVRSVWTVTTQSFPEAHFATYPEALIRPMIMAGTSEVGCCPECAAPWVRKVERPGESVEERFARSNVASRRHDGDIMPRSDGGHTQHSGVRLGRGVEIEDMWWEPGCDHVEADAVMEAWATNHYPTLPAIILDPFCGAATTALVARKLGRHALGIELSGEYCAIAARRLAQQSLLA